MRIRLALVRRLTSVVAQLQVELAYSEVLVNCVDCSWSDRSYYCPGLKGCSNTAVVVIMWFLDHPSQKSIKS